MISHVLSNLLNELKKRYNARLVKHFITFCIELNAFNNTRARMLDSIYHMALRLFEISFLP